MVAAMVEGRRRWRAQLKAEGRKFPGGRKLGSKVVKGGKQTFVVQLPRQYRHMSVDEFIEASKQVLKHQGTGGSAHAPGLTNGSPFMSAAGQS